MPPLIFFMLKTSDDSNKIENVLMIVIDCLRADHLRCYGYPIQTAASIDAWADVGNQFMFASGCTRTMYAMANLLTGRRYSSMSEKHTYLSEGNGLLWQALESKDCFCYSPNAIVNGILLPSGWEVPGEESKDWLAKDLTDRAISRIEKQNGWFGLLWYGDVHAYQTFFPVQREFHLELKGNIPKNTEWGGRCLSYLYDMAITHVDLELRRLWKMVNTTNTAIIITADHGERLFPEFSHLGAPTPELQRVPLIIILPGQKPMNRLWMEPVSWLDLAPTIAGMFGLESPPEWEGRDLFQLLTESKNTPEMLEKLKALGYVS